MSGNRKGGGVPMYDGRRPSAYNGSSPRSRSDRERDEREQESIRYKDRERVRDRDRDRDRDRGDYRAERPRSRSPPRRYEGSRPLRPDDSPMGPDNRDSSSVSSMTNSPALSNRALNNNNYALNGGLPPKPNLDLPPPPPKAQPPTLPFPPAPPVHLPISSTPTLNSLIAGFLALIDEATQTSTLGVSLNTARETCDQRALEFNKSAAQHERYPVVKSNQKEMKELAEARYQAIEQQMEEKKSKVSSMATRAMEQLIPQVASMATSAKEKELREENLRVQHRCDSLEKSLQELSQTVTAQAQYIKDIQKSNALKDAEERIGNGVKAEFRKVTTRFESVNTDLLASTNNMETLRKELDDAKASISKAESSISDVLSLKSEFKTESANTRKYISEQTPILQQSVSDLKVLREQVKTEISQRKQDISALTQDVKDIKTTPQPQAQPVLSDNMFRSMEYRITAAEKSLSGRLAKVETDQQDDSKFKTYEQKVELLEQATQGNLKTVEDRVTKLESSRNDFKDELRDAIAADLNKLEERVDKVAEFQNSESANLTSNEVPAVSKDDLKEVETRLAQIEQSVQSIQTSRSSPAPLRTPSIPNDMSSKFTQFENDLKVMQAELQGVRDLQKSSTDAALNSINDLVETAIDEEVTGPLSELQKTVKSYESFLDLPGKVQNLETLHESHTSEMNELKRNLTAVITEKVVQSVHNDPVMVSHNQLEHRLALLQAALNNALTSTNTEVVGLQTSYAQIGNEVQALTNMSNNHETRINNVTTGQMTNHIIDQLKETIPDLQMVGNLRADFNLLRQKIDDLTNNYRTLLSSSEKNDESLQELEKVVTATKATTSTRFTQLIMDVEDLGKRIDVVKNKLDKPEKPSADLQADLNALREGLATLKDTQVHDLSTQLEALKNDLKALKKTHPDNLITQLNEIKARLGSLEDVEPEDFEARLEEIKEKIETLSTIHEQVPSMQGEIATQQQQINRFNEKQEKLLALDGKVTEVNKAVEGLKEEQANIMKVEGQLTTMQKQIEELEKQQKAKPTHLNTMVNGANGNMSSPNTPRSASISSHRNRQESVASAASDSNKPPKPILPPAASGSAKRQPSSSTSKASETTPKPSAATPTINGVKNRSTNATGPSNDISKLRPSIDPGKSRSIRPETHKSVEKPIGSDLNPGKKRKHPQNASSISEPRSSFTSGNLRPTSKRAKNRAFMPDDDDDEAGGNIERPKMAGEDVESDDEPIFMREIKAPQKPKKVVPGDDQDFKRSF